MHASANLTAVDDGGAPRMLLANVWSARRVFTPLSTIREPSSAPRSSSLSLAEWCVPCMGDSSILHHGTLWRRWRRALSCTTEWNFSWRPHSVSMESSVAPMLSPVWAPFIGCTWSSAFLRVKAGVTQWALRLICPSWKRWQTQSPVLSWVCFSPLCTPLGWLWSSDTYWTAACTSVEVHPRSAETPCVLWCTGARYPVLSFPRDGECFPPILCCRAPMAALVSWTRILVVAPEMIE